MDILMHVLRSTHALCYLSRGLVHTRSASWSPHARLKLYCLSNVGYYFGVCLTGPQVPVSPRAPRISGPALGIEPRRWLQETERECQALYQRVGVRPACVTDGAASGSPPSARRCACAAPSQTRVRLRPQWRSGETGTGRRRRL